MDASVVIALHTWATAQPTLGSVISFVAQAGIFLLPAVLVIVWLGSTAAHARARDAVATGVAAAVIAFAIGYVLEHVLNRPRPFLALGLTPLFPHAADSSFPSDHTLIGVALVGAMLWRVPRIGAWLFLWTLLVGLARVAAGVHYPSDIAASAVLGLVVDGAAWFALVAIRRHRAAA